MIRRLLLVCVAILLLLPLAAPAAAQSSGSPIITLTHTYQINEFGFGVLNDTVTFHNNGTSTVQIPSFQLGIPDSVASHAVSFVVPQSGFTGSPSDNGTVTTITVTPSSPSLSAGTTTKVSVEAYLNNVLNITAGSTKKFGAVVLLSPSVNIVVNTLNLIVEVPSGGTLTPSLPSGWVSSPTSSPPSYSEVKSNVTSAILTKTEVLNATDEATFLPVQVFSVTRTIVPSGNGYPQVEDLVSLRNLASYTVSDLPLTLLSSSIGTITIVPWSNPPLVDPTIVSLTDGSLTLTNPPFSESIPAGANFTFAMLYNAPSSLVKTSGSTVSVSLPYTLPIQAVVGSYVVTTQLPPGMHSVGQGETRVTNATPFNQGTVDLSYSVSVGWAAGGAVPLAALLFVASFVVLALRRPKREQKEEGEEEEGKVTEMLPDLIKGLEDKVGVFGQFLTQSAAKSQGTVTRADFAKIRNEIDALKSRSTNRLNELRQSAGSKRFVDLMSQIQDAEREEDRSAKDLLNLYDQYHSRRMREETFRRLLPNYRKRWDGATNHLSDLLNVAQREGKQA